MEVQVWLCPDGTVWQAQMCCLHWPELQLYTHLPTFFLWRPGGVIFVPRNAERFITCQSMTPFHFQLATSTAPPR